MPFGVWNEPTANVMNGIPDDKPGNVAVPAHIRMLTIHKIGWRG